MSVPTELARKLQAMNGLSALCQQIKGLDGSNRVSFYVTRASARRAAAAAAAAPPRFSLLRLFSRQRKVHTQPADEASGPALLQKPLARAVPIGGPCHDADESTQVRMREGVIDVVSMASTLHTPIFQLVNDETEVRPRNLSLPFASHFLTTLSYPIPGICSISITSLQDISFPSLKCKNARGKNLQHVPHSARDLSCQMGILSFAALFYAAGCSKMQRGCLAEVIVKRGPKENAWLLAFGESCVKSSHSGVISGPGSCKAAE